ncbi:hypothetical protein GCM10011368_33630 [Hyunsoonleella pacifica]|nr:hypothetical protein GCM10011368_33630 [Hyunsoonleella pacifica]
MSFAQQMYVVFQDNVKPSKMLEYEKAVKAFNDSCTEHNVDAEWYAAAQDDFTYYYITPIENMAELDKRPMKAMAEAMGDKFQEMITNLDKCATASGSYIMYKVDDLSYKAPEGTDMTDQNHRVWYELHYQAENKDKVKEGMKAIKAMFEEKGSKEYYNIYHSGFGTMENFYLVSVAAKDGIDSETRAKANQDVLGPDRYDTFNKLLAYLDEWVEHRGRMRPDLSYMPKKEEQ